MKLTALFLLNLFIGAHASSQVIGKILNDRGEPIHGATVRVINSDLTVFSDSLGRFKLNVIAGKYVLLITAVGYADQLFHVSSEDKEFSAYLARAFRQLDEVVVSAEKKEQNLLSIPSSLSVISNKQIEQWQLTNVKEITAVVPNLYSANPGDNRNVTSLRGIVNTGYDPAVATYIDGISQFNLDTYIPELLDVQRIEVLRAPQGTLYGRNAMGGVINIITKKPTNQFDGFVKTQAGSYGYARVSAGISSPIVKDKLFCRIAAAYNHLNGFYTNDYYGTHYDRQQSVAANLILTYILNEKWSIDLQSRQQITRNDGAFPLVFGKQEAFSHPYHLNQNATATMVDNVFDHSFNIGYSGNKFNFHSQSAFQSNYRYYKKALDADFSPLDGISIYDNYGNKWNNVKAFTQEVRLGSSARETEFNWTAGSFYYHQYSPVRQSTVFGKDARMLGAPDSLFSIENVAKATGDGISIYAQGQISLNKKLQLTGGMRYDHEQRGMSVSSQYHKDNFSMALVDDTSASVHFYIFSPRAGVLYKIDSSSNIFFNYSRGYRTGGLTQISADPSQPPLFPFKPEFGDNFELGFKSEVRRQMQFFFTGFFAVIHDAQIPVLVLPDAITITRNAGELVSKGFDVETKLAVVKGLLVNYNFGFNKATYRKGKAYEAGQEIDLEGKNQVFTPDVTSFLDVQYHGSLSRHPSFKFHLGAQWVYIGKQYFDLANSIDQGPYQILNLNAGVAWKKISLSVWSKNVTDTRFIDYAYDFGAVHLADPGTWGVGVAFNF